MRAGFARDSLAIQIKLVFLAINRPLPLQHFCVLGLSDEVSSPAEIERKKRAIREEFF
jgi:hypothetical protein